MAACYKGPYRASPVHRKLAPFRGAPPSALRYAAAHLRHIYPDSARRHPIPVRPVLGLPAALRRPGQALEVQYLQRATRARATPPRRLWLARRQGSGSK